MSRAHVSGAEQGEIPLLTQIPCSIPLPARFTFPITAPKKQIKEGAANTQ